MLTWNIPVFCCLCPCPILSIRNIAEYFRVNSGMSQISSKSSSGFPFDLEKNTKSYYRLPGCIRFWPSLYPEIILIQFHWLIYSFSNKPLQAWSLQVLFPLHGRAFPQIFLWQSTSFLTRLWSKVTWPVRPCLTLLNKSEPPSPSPSSSSIPFTIFFLSSFYLLSVVYCMYLFIYCISFWLGCKLHEDWHYFIHCYVLGAWHMLVHSRYAINSCWINLWPTPCQVFSLR